MQVVAGERWFLQVCDLLIARVSQGLFPQCLAEIAMLQSTVRLAQRREYAFLTGRAGQCHLGILILHETAGAHDQSNPGQISPAKAEVYMCK